MEVSVQSAHLQPYSNTVDLDRELPFTIHVVKLVLETSELQNKNTISGIALTLFLDIMKRTYTKIRKEDVSN